MHILFMPLVFWNWLCITIVPYFPPCPFVSTPDEPYKFTVKLVEDDEPDPRFRWFVEDIKTDSWVIWGLWKGWQFFNMFLSQLDPRMCTEEELFNIQFRKSDCIALPMDASLPQIKALCQDVRFEKDSIWSPEYYHYYCRYGEVVVWKGTGYIVSRPLVPCMYVIRLYFPFDSVAPENN